MGMMLRRYHEQPPAPSKTDVEKMKVKELDEALKEAGLPLEGKAEDKRAALKAHYESAEDELL